LDVNTIAFAVKKYNAISLNNLYDSHKTVNTVEDVVIEPISKAEESLIRQEYLNAKNNTTLNLIRTSIKEGIELEHMAIEELNEYIDKKVNKNKETEKLIKEIKYLKGKEETLIPMVMKNGLNMSISQINNINSLLNKSTGIGNVFNSFLQEKSRYHNENIKEGIEILENKIKKFTTNLKEGKDQAKDDYKDILEGFNNLNNSFNAKHEGKDESRKKFKDYLELQNKLSKDDLVLQLPISAKDGYKNINLIIPNAKRGIDKSNMVFYLNMDMENLGEIIFNLKVIDNEIYIDFKAEKEEKILGNKHILEEGLSKIGYNLEEIQTNHEV
jgi:hypothetical protein